MSKKKEEVSEMQKMNERLKKLEELEIERATSQPSQRHEDPCFDAAPEPIHHLSGEAAWLP